MTEELVFIVDPAPGANEPPPDILQQALAEVTAPVVNAASKPAPEVLVGSDAADDLSFLLTPAASNTSDGTNILEHLGSMQPNPVKEEVEDSKERFVTLYRSDSDLTGLPETKVVGVDTPKGVPIPNFLASPSEVSFSALNPSKISVASTVPPNVVLVPNSNPDGLVTFMMKPTTAVAPQPQLQPSSAVVYSQLPHQPRVNVMMNGGGGGIRPSVNTVAPTIVAPPTLRKNVPQGGGVNTPLTAVLRPVMTPTIAKPAAHLRPQRQQPLLLPKMPPPPMRLPVMLPKAAPIATPVPVPVAPPAPSNSVIQLVQKGSRYHTNQPLNSAQLKQVAQAIKKNGRATEIVVEAEPNSKVVYKVMYGDDDAQSDPSGTQGSLLNPDVVESSDSDDYLSDTDARVQAMADAAEAKAIENAENFYPHELFTHPPPSKKRKKKGEVIRRRGRPKRGQKIVENPDVVAKRLKKEFGLSTAQFQSVDLVDDRAVERSENSGTSAGQEDDADEEGAGGEQPQVQASRTRSGRVSKPPAAIDEDISAKLKLRRKDETHLPPVEKTRRKMTVPERFRCAVCNKIYLGDRKMKKHMKLFPTHGPSPESLVAVSAASAAVAVSSSAQPTLPPPTTTPAGSGKKMPEFTMPIIPMARTQLEELVKNLDAELVMDVVSKKMFDNFTMWQLQSKKIASLPASTKGVARLNRLLDDMDKMIGEAKRLVDNCLSDTKLCGDEKVATLSVRENMQAALGMHEGPWYLEQPNHVPDEYRKLLGMHSSVVAVSPRSDSVTNLLQDDNSNSMLSLSSDRDQTASHGGGVGGGMGAQMVLERNLGAQPLDTDEDTQDNFTNRRGKGVDDEDVEGEEEVEEEEEDLGMEEGEEDSNQMLENAIVTTASTTSASSSVVTNSASLLRQDVETKKAMDHSCSNSTLNNEKEKPVDTSSRQLAMEIDSLGPFPLDAPSATVPTSEPEPTTGDTRTRLPSFSSIIGGSPKTTVGDDDPVSVVTTTDSALGEQLQQQLTAALASSGPSVVPTDSLVLPSVQESAQQQPQSDNVPSTVGPPSRRGSLNVDMMHVVQSGPPSVQSAVATEGMDLMSSAVVDIVSQMSGPHSVASVDQQHYAGSHVSGPPSVASIVESAHHVSGPPSVAPPAGSGGILPSVDHHISGPPSVASMVDHHISGPPSVSSAMDVSGQVSCVPVASCHVSGPPSVPANTSALDLGHCSVSTSGVTTAPVQSQGGVQHETDILQTAAATAQIDFIQEKPQSQAPQLPTYSSSMATTASSSTRPSAASNPPSVRMLHHSNPASVDHHHQSIPNSPLSDVLSDNAVHSPMPPSTERRRGSVTNVTLAQSVVDDGEGGLVVYGPAPQPESVAAVVAAAPGLSSQPQSDQKGSQTASSVPGPSSVGGTASGSNQAPPPVMDHDSNSRDQFLSDLDSVLNDSADFPFTSALSGESTLATQLKTPEKLLRSIPPTSMMVPKASPAPETPSTSLPANVFEGEDSSQGNKPSRDAGESAVHADDNQLASLLEDISKETAADHPAGNVDLPPTGTSAAASTTPQDLLPADLVSPFSEDAKKSP